MAKSMKLGGGGRFAKLARKVHSKALAAYIGRKKYGKTKMAKMSAAGRRRRK
jgi:hypothetical protein